MARRTYEAIITELTEAVKAEMIWNVDFKDIKDDASRNLSDERDVAMRRTYLAIPHDERPKLDYEKDYDLQLYYDSPTQIHLVTSKKLQKLLAKAGDTPTAEVVREMIERWTPVTEMIVKLKPLVQKGRKPSGKPAVERDLTNTGTCACCGRNVKLNRDGGIVDHGYQVPWHWGGARTASCFGTRHLPVEVSDEGLKAVRKALKREKVRTEEYIAKVEAGELPVTYTKKDYSSYRNGRPKEILITVEPTESNYEARKSNMLRRPRRSVEDLEQRIPAMAKVIKDWEPTLLPKEEKADFEARVKAREDAQKAAQPASSSSGGPSCMSEATVTCAPAEGACPDCGTFKSPRWCQTCGGR